MALVLAACDGADEREANHRLRGKELFEQGELTKAKLEFRNALQIKPTSVEAIYYLGQIAEAENDLSTATTAYRQVVEQDAKHVPAQLKLGQFYLIAQDQENALKKAHIVLELEPRNADARALQAAIYNLQGLPEQAEAEAREALAVDATNIGAISVLAGLRAKQERVDDALTVIADGLKLNPQSEGLRQVRLQILIDAKRMVDAEDAYAELVNVAPTKHRYKINYARLLISEGKIDEAETMLRRAGEANPDDKNLKMLLVAFLAEKRGWSAAIDELKTLSTQDPSEPSYRFRLADFYVANGAPDEARAILQDVIGKEGTSPLGLAARASLARIMLNGGKAEEATELVAAVLKADPRSPEALLLRASMAAERQDTQAAIADLRTILRDQPNSAPALSLLARTYLSTGESELAVDAYRSLLVVAPSDVGARLALVNQLRTLDRNDEALEELEFALKLAPDSVAALKAKALMMIEQGNLALAENLGAGALAQQGGEPIGNLVLGLVALARKDNPKAIEQLTASVNATPRPDEALPALIEAHKAAGRTDEAERVLADLIAKEPDNGTALVLRADIQFTLGDAASAESTLREAIASGGAWPVPYLKLGSLYQKQTRHEAALKIYEDGLTRSPTNLDLLLRSALTHETLGQYEAARTAYEAVLTQRSDHRVASNNLANLIVDVWPTDPALMDQARRLAEPFRYSSEAALLDTLGWIQLRIGNTQDAIQLIERATSIASDDQQIRYHLGLAYRAQGDLVRAKVELEKAVAGTPNYRGVENARNTLATIGSTVGQAERTPKSSSSDSL